MILRRRESPAERIPNLAPMVDVIMVLLVFFILGASLEIAHEGVLQTELDPRSGPGPGAPIEIIPAVKIALAETDDGSCVIVVAGQPLAENSFAGLRALLVERRRAGADTRNPIVIAAQGSVRWRHVVSAMDAAVGAGFANVQFAVRLGGGGE